MDLILILSSLQALRHQSHYLGDAQQGLQRTPTLMRPSSLKTEQTQGFYQPSDFPESSPVPSDEIGFTGVIKGATI